MLIDVHIKRKSVCKSVREQVFSIGSEHPTTKATNQISNLVGNNAFVQLPHARPMRFQSMYIHILQPNLDSAVPTPTARTLDRIFCSPRAVFEEVGNVTNGISVRKQVPTPSTITIVIKP